MGVHADRARDYPGLDQFRQPEAEPSSGVGRSVLDELMTAREVASVLQMKLSTVEDYARRGVLPSVKVGRHRRFIRSQLERALGELTGKQP